MQLKQLSDIYIKSFSSLKLLSKMLIFSGKVSLIVFQFCFPAILPILVLEIQINAILL